MKNYFQKIITLFTGNDYPESTQQDFYKWLVDEEHTSEKDEACRMLRFHQSKVCFPLQRPQNIVFS